ncbi:MAG: hypothetical protein WED09_13415 [Homoserinimonas sp.]
MDELMDRRLRNQEQALRAAMSVFAQASNRLGSLGSSVGWLGPASLAYDLAISSLRVELRAAENHLGEALHDTINALSAGENSAELGCG